MFDLWRRAVDRTHGFLNPSDRVAIESEVERLLPRLQCWVAVDQADTPIGFISAVDCEIGALFVDPDHHGIGVGRCLVELVLGDAVPTTVSVNEQNEGAKAFYARLGFRIIGRSVRDEQGRDYPLLHMARDAGQSDASRADSAQCPHV